MIADLNLAKFHSTDEYEKSNLNIMANTNLTNLKKHKSTTLTHKDTLGKNQILGYYIKPHQAFGISDKIINDNIIFINTTKVLFISGCNLVISDLNSQEVNFVMRNSPLLLITSMSVGYKSEKDPYICLGEYDEESNMKQISVISINDNKIQYVLFKKDQKSLNWKIIFARILKNSSNCVSISKKDSNPNQSQLAFWKFTQELFVSDAIIDEDVRFCSYNPKNTYELVVCGRNYLRLWNVFINQGILREHPQRFLKSKQEKEYTFINIEFFEKKSFMFCVGTLENVVFIIEGFIVLAEINMMYMKENILDLNLQNQLISNDEHDEGDYKRMSLTGSSGLHMQNLPKDNNSKSKSISEENIGLKRISNKTGAIFFDVEKINFLRCIKIIGNNSILVTFQQDSISYIYKIDKDLKNAVNKKEEVLVTDENLSKHKGILEEIKVERLANNINQIISVAINEDGSKIIYLVEIFTKEDRLDTTFRLLLFYRKNNKLIFEKEIFRNYINKHKIKKFGLNEKKKIFFTLTDNFVFRCFDYNHNAFLLQHQFSDEPLEIVSCPNNNLIGISFRNKFSLFFILKDKITSFMDFEIYESNAKFSEKGEFLTLSGCNPVNKLYSILFIETLNFNIIHAIENVKAKVKKLLYLDNDKLLFVLLDNNLVRGFSLSFDFLSVNLMNRFRDRGKSVNGAFINLFYKHFPKGDYKDFYYDWKNDLLVVSVKNSEKLLVINKKGNHVLTIIELPVMPESLKIILELKCLLVGLQNGVILVFKWPIDINETMKVVFREYLVYRTNLHSGPLIDIIITNDLKNIFTASSDGSVYCNELYVRQGGEYKHYQKFLDFNGSNLKIECLTSLSDLYDFRINEIRNIDNKVENLINNKTHLEKANRDNLEVKKSDYEKDLKSLEDQKNDAIEEENKKLQNLMEDIKEMKLNVENEIKIRHSDHDLEKAKMNEKNEEKLKLYRNEIDRLNAELHELEINIEDKFKYLINTQNELFNNLFTEYLCSFSNLKENIENNIEILVKTSAEYDDAFERGKSDYDKMIQKLKEDTSNEIEAAQKMIEEKRQTKSKVLSEENNLKNILDSKVVDSDDIIKKNVQIKVNIIDTTQRSITLQEQLIETEKNLVKIDKKMEQLASKNNHLEQIRFVLEHRMSALEKEKGPLEEQCHFLENKKYNLQSEFNRLILEISKKNQVLENKQSQLKACLIQNFEINDHIKYMKKKLNHLHGEVFYFIKKFHDENMVHMNIQEKKATSVALHLRNFYDKYFETTIDEELINYKDYSHKLQEESDKINFSNNIDLMLRDKGEEKILNENFKLEQISLQKERGFKRMQDENTILISECNRLRKNLHEVYMHVVDIEGKFEDLTKINPTLNKTEIVNQIKQFIKKTHGIIKNNYDEYYLENIKKNMNMTINGNLNDLSRSKSNTFYLNNKKENSMDNITEINNSKIYQGDILRNLKDNQNNLADQRSNLEALNNQIIRAVTPQSQYIGSGGRNENNDYENFLVLPEIKNQILSNVQENNLENDISKRVNTNQNNTIEERKSHEGSNIKNLPII